MIDKGTIITYNAIIIINSGDNHLTTLQKTTKSDYVNIKKLYTKAFPWNEQEPFFLLKKLVSEGKADILKFETDGVYSGLAISLLYDKFVLVDYFAIDDDFRGKGFGSEALLLIRNWYKDKKLFLEIEKPGCGTEDDSIRVRRRNFYLKNGLIDCNISILVDNIPMDLLTFGETITYEDYISVLRGVFGGVIFRYMNPSRILHD